MNKYKVGDAVVVSGGHAGRDGDVDFIALKDGCYWWHGIIKDTCFVPKGWDESFIRVKHGTHLGSFTEHQIYNYDDAMERINRKDIFEILAARRSPIQRKVARYTFDMSTDRIRERLDSLVYRIQGAGLLEHRNVELVQEYEALHDVYRRRARRGV